MACCSEYQNECLRVVTIGYLKSFIGNEVQDSTNGAAMSVNHSDNTYCPTYAELTGGSLIQNWQQGSTPKGDRDGIVVGGSYAANQLVRQQDLSLKYTRFSTLSIGRSGSGNMSECGDNATLTYTYNYNRYTKSMNSSSCATGSSSTNVASICGELAYHTTYGSVSNCTSYSIGKNGSVSANSRTDSIYADVTFRGGYHKSNTITITQKALTGSYSVWDKNIATGVTAWATTSTSFGCSGGNYGASATGYYKVQKHWKDSCGTEYTSLTAITDTGQSVSLGSKTGSFGSVTCPTTNCAGSDSLKFTFTSGGSSASDSVSFTRSGSNDCSCSKATEWESYDCSQHPGETITVNGTAYTNCVQDAQGNCNCTATSTSKQVKCDDPGPEPCTKTYNITYSGTGCTITFSHD